MTIGFLFPTQGRSQALPPKVLFDGTQVVESWKISSTEGATHEVLGDGVKFTIEAWKEGKNMWPRLLLQGPGIDLSYYSNVIVELENPTAKAESIAVSIAETTPRSVGQAVSISPQSSIKVILNISDGAPLDQSNITTLNLYESRPFTTSTYILRKVTAIQNPDFTPARKALGERLSQAQQAAASFQKNTTLNAGDAAQFQASQELIASADQEFKQQARSYITSVQKKLDEAQQGMAQLGMKLRQTNSLVWTSPLGLAIREGTLPGPTDQVLSAIDQQVALNEYQAFCVNISAAQHARNFDVSLEKGPLTNDIIALRPTLFSKARDGSQTADAIGAPTSQLKVEVPAFQTRQLIVWVDTKQKNAKPGRYTGKLKIASTDSDELKVDISVNITVENVSLASSLPVNVLNYSYFYMGQVQTTKGLEKEAVQNLRDYGINTWVINYDQMPLPLVDDTGKYSGLNAKDRNRVTRFRQVMDLLKGNPQETFILWFGFQRPEVRELLGRPGVLEGYLKDLHALLDEYQVPLPKRYIQFWDEPKADQVRESVEWMKKIRALDSSFQFFCNTSAVPTDNALASDYRSLVNRLMPNWEQYFVAQPEKAQVAQALNFPEFGFYRCLMSRNNRGVNIYEYYRLMGWYLMQNGYNTLGFWTYNAGTGEDVWDGTTGSASGGVVVYNKDNQLLTSRRWELFREGLEDYKLMLAALGSQDVLKANSNPAVMAYCRQVINAPGDYQQADIVRGQLINAALRRATS